MNSDSVSPSEIRQVIRASTGIFDVVSGLERARADTTQAEPLPPVPVGNVRRFNPATDIDDWLLSRLHARWPNYADQTWRNKLTSFALSNTYYFVTNERCVLLMEVKGTHSITGKPVVLEVFALSRDAKIAENAGRNWTVSQSNPEGIAALSDLYKAAKTWMEGMNAARMIAKTCSDLTPSVVKNVLGGDYIVDLVNR
jgi:hypothetical protein